MVDNTAQIQWRLARLARRRRILTNAALRGELDKAEADFFQPTASVLRLKDRLARSAKAGSAALAFLAMTGSNAMAGGSGLQIETALTPWWTFLTGTVPWWAGTVAIVLGAIVLMFSGFGQGGSRIVSALAGACIAAGVIIWVMPSIGASQAGLLLP